MDLNAIQQFLGQLELGASKKDWHFRFA